MANTAGSNGSTYSERLTQAAHETIDRVGEQAADMERRLKDKAGEVRRKSTDGRDRAQEMGQEAVETARSYAHDHPFATLAVAFGAGVLLSSLVRR